MGTMRTMDRTGDEKISWDPKNEAETEAARRTFDELVKAGHLAYRVKLGGGKGDMIKEFDPKAERIVLAPQMAGG